MESCFLVPHKCTHHTHTCRHEAFLGALGAGGSFLYGSSLCSWCNYLLGVAIIVSFRLSISLAWVFRLIVVSAYSCELSLSTPAHRTTFFVKLYPVFHISVIILAFTGGEGDCDGDDFLSIFTGFQCNLSCWINCHALYCIRFSWF